MQGQENIEVIDGSTEVRPAEVLSALSSFGLENAEISVYKAILELGSRPAGIIAQKSGLKRGQTYNVLAQLMGKGIVQEFIKNNVRHFTCSPPQTLISVVENRAEEIAAQKEKLQRIIPYLEKIRNPLATQPKVRFFNGVEGVKEIFEDMIRVPKQNIYGLMDLAYTWCMATDEVREWMKAFVARRAQNDIWYYGIINKSEASDFAVQSRKAFKRKLKMIEGITLPVEINVYGSKVAMISTHKEAMGLIIENQDVAETLHNIHQAVWNFLPDYKI